MAAVVVEEGPGMSAKRDELRRQIDREMASLDEDRAMAAKGFPPISWQVDYTTLGMVVALAEYTIESLDTMTAMIEELRAGLR